MSILDETYHQNIALQAKRSILIVDDDLNLLSKLQVHFKMDGEMANVYIAQNAHEGLKLLSKNQIDLLVIDMVMPHMDGIAFLEHCHSHHLINQTKVIAMGECNDPNIVLETIHLGASHYLYKPFDASILVSRSRTVLNIQEDANNNTKFNDLIKLRNMLLNSGLPVHTLGYKYFIEAIKYVLVEDLEVFSITKTIYPYVASLFQTSGSNVDKAMRHSLTLAFDQNQERLASFLSGMNYKDSNKKPSNSEFISLILENMRKSENFLTLKS